MRRDQRIRQSIFWGLPLIAVSLLDTSIAAQGNQGAKETFQIMALNDIGTVDLATGAIRLTRARNEIWGSVHITELVPNSGFTLWGVFFNEPGACTTNLAGPVRCGMPDLVAVPNPAKASAFNVGAFVSDGTGAANGDINIRSGMPPEGTFILFGRGGSMLDNGISPGLHDGNGFGVELHLVVRTHGPILPASIGAQLSMINGGCPPNPTCTNVQVATFPSVTP